MATGDLDGNVERLLSELAKIRYPSAVDLQGCVAKKASHTHQAIINLTRLVAASISNRASLWLSAAAVADLMVR